MCMRKVSLKGPRCHAHLAEVVLEQSQPALQHAGNAVHVLSSRETAEIPHDGTHLCARAAESDLLHFRACARS